MATEHTETERKYDGATDRPLSAAELPRVARLRAGGTLKLDAVYYDTPSCTCSAGASPCAGGREATTPAGT